MQSVGPISNALTSVTGALGTMAAERDSEAGEDEVGWGVRTRLVEQLSPGWS